MNTRMLLLFVLTLFVQLINGLPTSNQAISKTVAHVPDYEVITLERNAHDELTLNELKRDIRFTPAGLTCYFRHVYSCKRYIEDVLPFKPFKHMSEFLHHGVKTKQNRVYTKAVIRLFDKKFKAVSFVSAIELNAFLQNLPEVLAKDLVADVTKKQATKKLIRDELETGFNHLKQDPDAFLDKLAEKIVLGHYHADDVTREQLCLYITKFIDLCLSKAMWSAQHDVWDLYVKLGRSLPVLHEKGIILDSDTLDDCQWTLLTRLVNFLSLWGSDLPMAFYQKAGEHISQGVDFLTTMGEQETGLQTKVEYLKEALVTGAMRANAKQRGLISEAAIKRS